MVSSEAKVASSEAKVASSEAKVASSEAKVASSVAKVASSVAKVASSVAKVASSVAKVASSVAKVASSVAKVALEYPECSVLAKSRRPQTGTPAQESRCYFLSMDWPSLRSQARLGFLGTSGTVRTARQCQRGNLAPVPPPLLARKAVGETPARWQDLKHDFRSASLLPAYHR
jgi:hypothetical protein